MKRVLVIDDDPAVARLVTAALKGADVRHILDYCSDGGQGRVKAIHGEYDLIALDLAMPLMGGVEALEEIKRNPKSAHVPVVVVTALQDADLHKHVKELGATAVLTKPFELWELVSIFRVVLAGEEVEPPAGGSQDGGSSPGPESR